MLNTTRLLATKLALAYRSLMSCGDLGLATFGRHFVSNFKPKPACARHSSMSRAIRTIEDAYNLPFRLTPANVYADAFLPPLTERKL